jgi:UDP-N-acetylmuramate--alanine ligase
MHPNKKVLAVFQPHLFSRTRDFADEFAKSLSRFDSVLLLEIYPAREIPITGIDSDWLLGKMTNYNKKLVKKEAVMAEIKAQNPEVLVTMGAGDIGLEIEKIKNELAYKNELE